MKILILICCVFYLALTGYSQALPGNGSLKLRGPVKKVEIFLLDPANSEDGSGPARQPVMSMTYNRQGYILSHTTYSVGLGPSKIIFLYNSRGRPILSESDNEKQGGEYFYRYDSSGRIVEQRLTVPWTKGMTRDLIRTVLKYDARDNIAEKAVFHWEVEDSRQTYVYDRNDRLQIEASFDRDGSLKSKTTYSYQKNGLIDSQLSEGKDYGQSQVIYHYDQKGRLLYAESRPLRPTAEKKVYVYDDEKMTVEESVSDAGDHLLTKTLKKIDQYGNTLSERKYYTETAKKLFSGMPGDFAQAATAVMALGMGDREEFQYEYDGRGNWIKKIEFGQTEFVVGQNNENAELKPLRTYLCVITYDTEK